MKHEIHVPAENCTLRTELRMAERPAGAVILVHGSGVTRHDSLNRYVAASLVRAGFAALLVDLLEDWEARDRHHVFDIDTQAQRLVALNGWLRAQPATRSLGIGYFGTGVGAGVVLSAAARAPQCVRAIVVRGGRPDLALQSRLEASLPTLFIAAGQGTDADWVCASHDAACADKELVVIAGARDGFHEHGANEAVARHACRWFARHLPGAEHEARAA
jgi:putative phosphoribosyl transferase